MPPAPISTLEVAAALVFRNGKVLITQRFQQSHLGGLWEFPGGKREPGETFEDCLVRELREELDMDIRVGELVESLTHAYPEKTVHLKFFRCQWTASEPRAIGCPAFAWVAPTELDLYEFPAADQRLLGKLRSHPAWWQF